MSLILYYSPLSPPSRAVRSFLDLNNILYQGKVIDIMKGENKTAEFQNINPNQSLPALVDGGLKLFESHTILKYIAVKKGLDQFYPKNIQNRAKVDCFLDWSQTGFEAIGKYVTQCFLFPMMMKKPVPDNKEEMYKDAIDTLKFFESVFLKDRYILNQPSITIADIKATADLSTLFVTGLNFDEFPKIKELLQEIFSIKEIQNAYSEYINMVKGMKPNDSVLYILNGQDKKQSWKINLYFHPWSSPSRSTRTVLLYSGVEYNEKIINLQTGQNSTPEFKAINPNETIPALQEGNFNLFESNAIMRYVSKKHQLTTLYPSDPKLKAQVDQYLDFHCTEMTSLAKFGFTCFLAPMLMKAPVPNDKLQQQQDVIETLKFFYRVFLNNGQWKYINNQKTYTLADIKFGCDIAQLFISDLQFENIDGLSDYIGRILQIPEMRKSHQEYFSFLQSQKVGKFAGQCIRSMPIRPQEKLTLYFNFVSPPAKAAKSLLLLAQIPYTEKDIDVQGGENKKKPYTDINPNESIPALSYGQFNIFESHAIMKFICLQFNLTEFYPNFPLRSKIDQYLDYHHTNTSYLSLYALDFFFGPKFMKREMPKNKEERFREINEMIQFIIEVFLGGGKYKYIMGARGPTIADLTFIAQVTTLFFVDFDFTPYPALKQYLRNIYSIQPIRETYSKFFTVARFMGPPMNPFIMSIIKGTEEGQSSCCQLI